MEPGSGIIVGGIIGHADGEPGVVKFRFNGREVPLSVHYNTGAWTVIVCWACGDTRRAIGGGWCTACYPTPTTEL